MSLYSLFVPSSVIFGKGGIVLSSIEKMFGYQSTDPYQKPGFILPRQPSNLSDRGAITPVMMVVQ